MFMGLIRPLEQGEEIDVTLTFEQAGEMQIKIPVDHARKPDHGAMDHSKMKKSDDG
jgi:copper(I)-binding protein